MKIIRVKKKFLANFFAGIERYWATVEENGVKEKYSLWAGVRNPQLSSLTFSLKDLGINVTIDDFILLPEEIKIDYVLNETKLLHISDMHIFGNEKEMDMQLLKS